MRALVLGLMVVVGAGCNGIVGGGSGGKGGGTSSGGGAVSAGGGGDAVSGGGAAAGGGAAVGGGAGQGGAGAAEGGGAAGGTAGGIAGGSATGGGNGGGGSTTDAGVALYSTHLMIAFVGHSADLPGWIRGMKSDGYNHIWAHMDDYGTYYVTGLRAVLDAAQAVGGITVSPGMAGGMADSVAAQVVIDSHNHPAVTRIDGKALYEIYGHDSAQFARVVTLLDAAGIPRSSYTILVSQLYPIANGTGWVEHADGTVSDVAAVNHAFDIDPNIDGFINFAVDKGTSDTATFVSRVNTENRVTTQAAHARGKLTAAGVSAFYASVQFTDLGFQNAASLWQDILASTPRPELVTEITTNDYVELSYMTRLANTQSSGLAYVPVLSAGYQLGPTVRTPMLEHDGIQAFLRPWADAYLSHAAQPTFTADRMFAWYYLHPVNAPTIATIPPSVAALSSQLTQAWWSTSVYATGNSHVGNRNQVTGIQQFLAPQMGTIRMAAHLTAPAQLQINSTLSAVMPAGAAYFEVPQTLGTPTFSIVRNGTLVMTGSGRQEITNSVWPGAWNCLITEVP